MSAPQRFAPPVGRRPSLDWLAPSELAIDTSYQRPVEGQTSQRLIARIAAGWRWDLCLPLLVSRRADGSHFVVDGQHRLAAAALRGDIQMLPCFVRWMEGAAAEASLFLTANRARRGVSVLEDWHAAVAAGDEASTLLADLIRHAGLTVPRALPGGGRKAEAGEVWCIAGLRSALTRHGPAIVGDALLVVGDAFPDEVLDNAGALIGGMILVIASAFGVDRQRLFETALIRTSAEWSRLAGLSEIKAGNRRAQVMRDALLAAYHDGARAKAA